MSPKVPLNLCLYCSILSFPLYLTTIFPHSFLPTSLPLTLRALTEKIVAVLPRMKCPHRLEPHQIQGLDFIHIYPVIQWLVKLAIATKEEMGDYIRAFSEAQFSRDHLTPEVDMW